MSDDAIKMLTIELEPPGDLAASLESFIRGTANIVKKRKAAGLSDEDILKEITDLNRSFISPNKASAYLALALIRLAEHNEN